MKDLIVFGAGGLGRETMFQLQEMNRANPAYRLLGFADDRCYGTVVDDCPVLTDTQGLLCRTEDTCIVIAVGNPRSRRQIYNALRVNPYLTFPTVIAPNAVCSDRVRFGMGCLVGFGATLTVDITVGDFVLISNGCNIAHDAVLRDYATLYPAVHVSGSVTIGKSCEIGVGSSIIQGMTVGDGAILGAGCAVVRDIPPHCTAVGVPAKVIRRHEQSI